MSKPSCPPSLDGTSADWDAARYDRVSNPQFEWGRRVIARLAPQPQERILDLGCGTGRLTVEIAAAAAVQGLPRGGPMGLPGMVVGFDRSETMLNVAARAQRTAIGSAPAGSTRFVRGDGLALPFHAVFDAVFSAATLHWIADHDSVFRSVFEALRPGGRFVAQCGGGPNLQRLYARAAAMMGKAPYAPFFASWKDPWYFSFPNPAYDALVRAGFKQIETSLEAAPVTFPTAPTFSEFIGCVCVRHHLDRLPSDRGAEFLAELTGAAASDDPPFTLDYWRLNIYARRPGEPSITRVEGPVLSEPSITRVEGPAL